MTKRRMTKECRMTKRQGIAETSATRQRGRPVIALEGRNMTAQGNVLGLGQTSIAQP
jgi:hypothetical protein